MPRHSRHLPVVRGAHVRWSDVTESGPPKDHMPKTRWDGRRWVRSAPRRRENHDALDCVADLERMLDVCEARLAQTERDWIDHVASTWTMDGNPATRGTGHGHSYAGGKRRGKRRQRGATPSAGRYTGSAARPKGKGGAMSTRTAHYSKRAADRAVAWGDKRRPD